MIEVKINDVVIDYIIDITLIDTDLYRLQVKDGYDLLINGEQLKLLDDNNILYGLMK